MLLPACGTVSRRLWDVEAVNLTNEDAVTGGLINVMNLETTARGRLSRTDVFPNRV